MCKKKRRNNKTLSKSIGRQNIGAVRENDRSINERDMGDPRVHELNGAKGNAVIYLGMGDAGLLVDLDALNFPACGYG